MALEATEFFYYVENNVIVEHPIYKPAPYPRPREFGPNDPDSHLVDHGHWRRWIDDPGSPGEYQKKIIGIPTPNPAASPPRVERIDTLQNWSRDDFEQDIESQRISADQSVLDVRKDPGLNGLMDEINVAADLKRKELDNTPDANLASFNPVLDPRSGDSVQVSASLASQARALLASPVPFTPQQKTDLDVAATAWEGIVNAGDMHAAVPEVPPFARLNIGVFGEEFGRAIARRIQGWIEIELLIERNLDDAIYFVAIYDINAPDDRDDTTSNYLTTAQLANMGNGRFLADKNAINLQSIDTSLGIKFTLCKNHLSFPQFDRVTFEPDDLKEHYRFRWGGLA